MNPLDLLSLGTTLINKLWPDPAQANEAKLKLLELQQSGELAKLTADTQLAQGQIDINKVEAANPSVFVSGWRPFVGWTCGLAFFFKFVGGPMLFMIAQAFGRTVTLPNVDYSDLWPLLFSMLGLGAYRTYEKVKGAA
jgi:hypothetical protein